MLRLKLETAILMALATAATIVALPIAVPFAIAMRMTRDNHRPSP